VDGDGAVTAVVRRTTRPVAGKAPARPALFGTGTGHLVALGASGAPRAVLLGGPEEGTTADLPAGPVASTQWGDLVAVAADTAVVLWNPATGDVTSLRMRRGAKAVAFSPAGHRLYVLNDEARLQVLDRESRETIGTVDLPDSARAIRPDPLGAYLLVRAASGDAVWVVDPAGQKIHGTVRTEWASDLPTIVGSRFLLVREDEDVVALDLERDSLPEVGRIEGGAVDLWLPLDWTPRRGRDGAPEEEPEEPPAEAADAPAVPADTTDPVPGAATTLYLQISSSRNPAWANDLAQQLRAAGVAALVLPAGDSLYRVVVGPFGTRDEAEAAARSLGRPSFILEQGSAE
ncbi:MAG: SPOR domain-containing protein, partial [Actinomycetota bacterium]